MQSPSHTPAPTPPRTPNAGEDWRCGLPPRSTPHTADPRATSLSTSPTQKRARGRTGVRSQRRRPPPPPYAMPRRTHSQPSTRASPGARHQRVTRLPIRSAVLRRRRSPSQSHRNRVIDADPRTRCHGKADARSAQRSPGDTHAHAARRHKAQQPGARAQGR